MQIVRAFDNIDYRMCNMNISTDKGNEVEYCKNSLLLLLITRTLEHLLAKTLRDIYFLFFHINNYFVIYLYIV